MAEIAIKKKRPKNLDLPTIRLPLPGVLSILHRISGAVLFLLLPVLLWLFQQSLASPETYAAAKAVTSNFLVKIILLGLIWLYMHHFCAGIRYLLLDLHNLYANARNFGFSAADVLRSLPPERIRVIHLAGGATVHATSGDERWLDDHLHDAYANLREYLESEWSLSEALLK